MLSEDEMPSDLKPIMVRLNPLLYNRVVARAKAEHRSRSNFVEQLVREAFATERGRRKRS